MVFDQVLQNGGLIFLFLQLIWSLVHESPHEKLHVCIELAWGCSTVLGILLFMIEVIILAWIQFYNVLIEAAYVATAILVPFVVLFLMFAAMFYRKHVAHTYEIRKSGLQELELLKDRLETGDVDLVTYKPADNFANIVWMQTRCVYSLSHAAKVSQDQVPLAAFVCLFFFFSKWNLLYRLRVLFRFWAFFCCVYVFFYSSSGSQENKGTASHANLLPDELHALREGLDVFAPVQEENTKKKSGCDRVPVIKENGWRLRSTVWWESR